MTTGRINQVTILRVAATAGTQPPKGGREFTERGSYDPSEQAPERAATGPASYPIAPTEFPKGLSTTRRSDAGASSQGAIWAPQEGDTFRGPTPEAVDCLGLPPNVCE